jgi:MOSC domain-containing protein YiiM
VGDSVAAAPHGGEEKAVYAFAREELDWWEGELGRTCPTGVRRDLTTWASTSTPTR